MKSRIATNEKSGNLPIIGKIKIGIKAISEKSGKEYPKAIDWFVCTGKYQSLFDKAYPDKPNKISILFISDDALTELKILRNSKGDLYGQSDGEEYSIWNPNTKVYETFFKKDIPDIEERTSKKTGTKWLSTLTIRFIIPKIRGVLGLFQLETRGVASSIKTIRDTFDTVLDQAGTVTKIMFDLTVTKHNSQQPDNPSSYPVINLIPNVSQENLYLLRDFMESGTLRNVAYINDAKLLQLQEAEQKQLPEKIEVAEVVETETKETLFK